MPMQKSNDIEKAVTTLREFHEEYLHLFYNPDERAFIEAEILNWYEVLEKVITCLEEDLLPSLSLK